MRTLVMVVAVVMIAVSLSALTASAVAPPHSSAAIPSFTVTILERTPAGNTTPVFIPSRVSIAQVPMNVTIVFENNETSGGASHNLTIANATGVAEIYSGSIAPGSTASLTFTIEAMDNVTRNGVSFRPSRSASGGIAFFDGDHPATVGEIVLVGSGPVPTLYIEVQGEQVGAAYQFAPSVIIIPQVPIVLNVTFLNNQSVGGPPHTFTIDDSSGKSAIDTGLVNPQQSVTLEFTINSMTSITYRGRTFTPGPPPLGTSNGTVQFYCIPHVSLGMKGTIMLGSAVPAAGQETKGVFLRAYWIGMIGIAAMLVWIGVSYFLIKSSSPRFKDNKAHVRKGLP